VSKPTDAKPPLAATPEMDRLVDAVLRGDVVLPYPPGTGAFLLATLMLALAAAGWNAVVVPTLAGGDARADAVAEMIGVAAVLPTVTVPSALVAFGVAGGRRAMQIVAVAWLALCCGAFLVLRDLPASDKWILAVASFLLVFVLVVVNGASHTTFVVFKRKLRERRQRR
jgi:hypothetical protein